MVVAAVDVLPNAAGDSMHPHAFVDHFVGEPFLLHFPRISSAVGIWHAVFVVQHVRKQSQLRPVHDYAAAGHDRLAIAETVLFHFFHIFSAIDTCYARSVRVEAMLSYHSDHHYHYHRHHQPLDMQFYSNY